VKKGLFLSLMCLAALTAFGQRHTFDDLFPNLDPEEKNRVFSGVLTETRERDSRLRLAPPGEPGEKIVGFVLTDIRPACVVEFLTVIPYLDAPLELLDLYNAMGNIRDLKGRLYHSATRDENIPLFEDATRVRGPDKLTPIPDPGTSATLPATERIYIRLKDVNFGNSYYQGDISILSDGLLYLLSNFKNLSYGIFPVIRERKFKAQFYVEPIAEGVLVYSAAVAEVGDFISGMADVTSAIRKRIEVILGWLLDNIAGNGRSG
jgi:hypothetical protein